MGLTLLLATIAEVRYSPFYTYDFAFAALVDTLHIFQHIGTKLTMYWVKFSVDPEEDAYRYKQAAQVPGQARGGTVGSCGGH